MGAVSSAQQLANRLTEDAEKLADVLRKAILGVERVQLENERGASDWAHKAQSLTKLVGYLQIQAGSAIAHIPQQLRQAATHLIDRVVDLFGRDELYNDPTIRQLDWLARNQGLPVEERIQAQAKLDAAVKARDLIAKAQTAYEIYKRFGNTALMDQAHEQAEQSRQHLAEMGIQASFFEASKNLSSHYHGSAIQACEYDPLYTNAQVPLPQNEQYLFLLSLSMKDGAQGAWAKGQLDAIHGIIGQTSQAASGILSQLGAGNTSEAWRGFIQFVSLQQQLGKYHLFPPEQPAEEETKERQSSNPFAKSWSSIREIGNDFINAAETRADKALDSPYDFLNYVSVGITGGIYNGAVERADHMRDSTYDFANWLTLGTVEMAKGAVDPEDPLSKEHWLNSFGLAFLLAGGELSLVSKENVLSPKPIKGTGNFTEDTGKVVDGLEVIDDKVLGKVPLGEFENIRKISIHNPNADSIVLGKYTPSYENGVANWEVPGPDSYITKSGTDSTYFSLGSEWGKIQTTYGLADDEMFKIFNIPALDDAIASGKTIKFSHKPNLEILKVAI